MHLDCYRISSLVEQILAEGKDTFISLGMWEKEEKPFLKFSNVKYLWCKSLYPTAIWDLKDFPETFNFKTYHGLVIIQLVTKYH